MKPTVMNMGDGPKVRQFESGATRSADVEKPDYEGFLSPLVLKAFGEYMTKHRKQPDGSVRDSDNWQKGIPLASYIKSLFRHFKDLWLHHRGYGHLASEPLQDALAGIYFNVQGYWHETLKNADVGKVLGQKRSTIIEPSNHYADAKASVMGGSVGVREQMDPIEWVRKEGPWS